VPVTRSPRNVVLLIALYLSTVLVGLQPVTDPDIWWHLRTGQWIVEHHAVPTVDPFSTYGQGKPWVVYSWLFDVAVYALHRVGGLRGIAVYGFAACLAIMVSLHRLLGLVEPRPARAAALTALGFAAMLPILSPRSYLVSILAFILVLHAVVRARRDGRARALLWLPLLFALWANVHIQFVYGLAVLALATLQSALERWWDGGEPGTPSLRTWLLVDVACVLATLVTPYHVRLYVVLREVAAQTGVYYFNLEMRAIQFRETWDWIALGLVLGAAFTVGRRSPPRFVALLSAAGVFVSFRSGRDVWFVVVCATLLIAMAGRPLTWPPPIGRGTRWRALTAVVLAFSLLLARQSAAGLEARVRREFPADAAQAVEQGHYTGPLYNHFNWGGYLLWRLPHLLVSMDGRSHVHGDARIVQSMRTWAGVGDWRADPELGAAGVVIAGSATPLATLLRHDGRFREVHDDAVARVFVAVTPPAGPAGARR
jgi:hypothetical protein